MNAPHGMPPSQLSQNQRWILAARPKTLPAAAAPVLVGLAAAVATTNFRLAPALATLTAGLLLQIGANLANDYFDYKNGIDTPDRVGPVRVTQAGLLSPGQVKNGIILVFALAAGLGLYLAVVSGWPVIAIGVLAIVAAVAYTGGPFPYGYYGFGELFVFLFFGLAAVCGTYFIQAREFSWLSLVLALPMGWLTTNILVINNLRDLETDRASGRKTLAVRFGAEWTRVEFLLLLAAAYLVPLVLCLVGWVSPWVLLSWLSLARVPSILRDIYREKGSPLNRTLAAMGQLVLLFGILLSLGLILNR
jgi:1,4-dihydroxy-2-naphthoate octaprenyltransferase